MNATGVSWLGEVPAHWEATRLKNAARLVMGQSPSSDDCSTERIGLPFLQGCAEFGSDHPRPKQFCRAPAKVSPEGAVLISVRAPVGRLNFADQEYGIGRGLCAVVPDSRALSPAFARYCLGASTLGLALLSTGSTYDAVSVGDVAGLPVLVPPLGEQDAIVRFLDHVDRRIRRYIRAKQKLITLLEEQKQTIIRRAVTRGLDPNVRLKPSGVEWLEDVPEHWEVRRLKTRLRPVDRRSSSGREILLSLRRDYGIVVYAEHFSQPPQGATLVGYKLVETGQLVVNRLQANNGLLFCSGLSGVVSPDYSVFETRSPVNMEYLGNLLRTVTYKAHFRRESTGLGTGSAGFLRLYDDRLLGTPVALPPLEEQGTLLGTLGEITGSLDRAIGRHQVEVKLLSEYRTRLIADVVTGKFDVRGAATRLPDEDEALEPLDQADILTGDGHEATHDLDAIPEKAAM